MLDVTTAVSARPRTLHMGNDDLWPRGRWLHDLSSVAQQSVTRVIWLLVAIALALMAAIVIAGRAHSKRLDELMSFMPKGILNEY